MHAGRQYRLIDFLFWTRREMVVVLLLAAIPTLLYQLLDWKWLATPWVPIALVGTAAAFLVGFKNTQTYNRLWEARQIWGAIVNTSRAWGVMSLDFAAVGDKTAQQRLIYRHIAWLTALRFQLRESRTWENSQRADNKEYQRFYTIPERVQNYEEELKRFLSPEEFAYVWAKKNRATHILRLQSKELLARKEEGLIAPLNHVELENLIVNLYEQQGKCERIKNFPYPRQFATINLFFIRIFVFLVPFGMLQEFQKIGDPYVWLTIPFSAVVCWIFLAMEKIGESTENPFEGGANDVPITALSRTIEIDLREMLEEKELPPAMQPENYILM